MTRDPSRSPVAKRSQIKTETKTNRAITRANLEQYLAKFLFDRGIGSLRSTQSAGAALASKLFESGLVEEAPE